MQPLDTPQTDSVIDNRDCPHIPDDLLAWLDQTFPEVDPPNTQASLADLWRAFGTRAVVHRLKLEKRLQEDAQK